MNPDVQLAPPDDLVSARRGNGPLGSATDWRWPPMDWVQAKDLDVGHGERTDPLNASHLKMLVGQHVCELGRRPRALATMHYLNQWMPARTVAEDVGKHQHPGRAKHSGDLGHPYRRIRPVAQRHGREHQVKPGVGEGQTLGSSLHIPNP